MLDFVYKLLYSYYMKTYGVIYKHTNKITKKVYIGQTTQVDNIQRRFRHQDKTYNSYKSCPAFYNALVKYGWENFESEIILTSFDFEALNLAEEYFIKLFNCIAPNGYNTNSFSEGSHKLSENTKIKISEKRKVYLTNLTEPLKAVNKKEHVFIDNIECKECAKCKIPKPLNQFNKDSGRWDKLHFYCRDCHNEFRKKNHKKHYPKLSEEDFKKSYENRQNKEKQAKIYNDEPERRAIIAKQRSKPIIGTHIETGKEMEFESAKSAKQYGFDNTNIGLAIKNQTVYKKHIWKFK